MRPFSKRIKSNILFLILSLLIFSTSKIIAEIDIVDRINNLIETTTGKINADVPIVKALKDEPKKKKEWTLMIYISADNDLRNFAIRNIKQMAKIGSNKYINILVHLDIKLAGNKKATRRYYIKQNQILHLNAEDPHSQRMDSGNPETLISFCRWGTRNFPANHYGLILWDHGTGALDPNRGRIIKLSDLFKFNPLINKVEVDRSIGFFDLLNATQMENRGICWDDTTGNYLTGQNLDYALKKIKAEIGKDLDFVGFDACLMQMIEVANTVKKYSNIMIGSQEVILGTGWNYVEVLRPFQKGSLSAEDFSKHIVSSYKKAYEKITNDFTLSALRLEYIDLLEKNIDNVSKLLIACLKRQVSRSVKKAISTSRSKILCTHFDEPSFIDLHHFYLNLLATLKHFKLKNKTEETTYKKELSKELIEGCGLIEELSLANVSGKNLSQAKGISIYFPPRRIYYSYRDLDFCKSNNWILLLTQYLNV